VWSGTLNQTVLKLENQAGFSCLLGHAGYLPKGTHFIEAEYAIKNPEACGLLFYPTDAIVYKLTLPYALTPGIFKQPLWFG
jgi:hypothetical protein